MASELRDGAPTGGLEAAPPAAAEAVEPIRRALQARRLSPGDELLVLARCVARLGGSAAAVDAAHDAVGEWRVVRMVCRQTRLVVRIGSSGLASAYRVSITLLWP